MTVLRKRDTLKTRLDAVGGIGPGFDAIRLALSAAILVWHGNLTTYGQARDAAILADPLSAPITAMLPTFFALSGFLVMGSAERTRDVRRFLALRVIRIVPALLVEIVISAFLIGTVVTTLSLHDYFSSPLLLEYFGSLFGRVSFWLPGVFVHHPDPGRVNLTLWTIAPEILCYLYLGLLLAFRARRTLCTVSAVGVIVANLVLDGATQAPWIDHGVLSARLLVAAFAVGNLVYLWRGAIPASPLLFAGSLVAGIALIRSPGLVYVALACLAYAVACLGLVVIRLPGILRSGDYSYGIYLYAYPIQQLVTGWLGEARSALLNVAIALPLTFAAAAASWWAVEKPALGLRRTLHRGAGEGASLWTRLALGGLLGGYAVLITGWLGLWPEGMRVRYVVPSVALACVVALLVRHGFARLGPARLGPAHIGPAPAKASGSLWPRPPERPGRRIDA